MININFLAYRVKQQSKQKDQDKRLFRISSITLAVACVIMIGVFAFKFYNTLTLTQTKQKITDYKASILAQEKTEIAYLIFVNKIKVITEIYQKRSDKQTAMNYFADSLRGHADIIGMTYQEEEGGLSLQVSSDNVFKFDTVQGILDSAAMRERYQNIKKSTLSREDTGAYRLTLQLQLKTQWQ
jgi:hypothetical protein